MKPETEQTLATIELILEQKIDCNIPCHWGDTLKPYVWNSQQQGIFSPLSFLKSQGWIQETDLEKAIENWQWSENTGLAAKRILEDDPCCIEEDEDEAEILLDEKTKITRAKNYQNILQLLSSKTTNLQAFELNCNQDYSLSVAVAEVAPQQWIALSPTVPQETSSYIGCNQAVNTTDDNCSIICSPHNKEKNDCQFTDDVILEIKKQIDRLSKIEVYGWYDGGYETTHEYQILMATGDSKEVALQNILLKSKFLEIYKFDRFNIDYQLDNDHECEADNYHLLHRFLQQSFSELLLYRFCFWDYEHIYILGEKGENDRVGVYFNSQFTYNP